MKKITLKLFWSIALLFCVAVTSNLFAQAASSTWSLTSNMTSAVSGNVTSADMVYGSTNVGTIFGSSFGAAPNTSTGWMRVSTTSPNLPAAYTATSYVEFTISPAVNNNLTVTSITGNVAGGGSSNVKLAGYYSLDNFASTPGTSLGTCTYNGVANKTNTTGTPLALANTSTITTLAEGPIIYSPSIIVNNGQTLKIRLYAWSTSTLKYLTLKNIVVSGTTVTLSADPVISKTSGSNPASVMESYAMTPVVYTYANVADDANVSAEWYTDATYTTTTSAPSGLSLTKDGTANTVTVSGTPALSTAGTHYYKLIVNETNGNSIEGSVVVAAYVTPTPTITLSSGTTTQGLKAGNAITNIVYNLTNVTGATVTGLPTGLSGLFASTGGNAGTYTISGTVDGGVTPGLNNYTVTATAMPGYVGSDITSAGKIIVKKADAKSICYLVATATQSANDTKLYPYLNEGTDYLVTLRQAATSAPAASVYDSYDAILVNEVVSGANVELVALETVDKPIVSLKAFTYQSGRWDWGTNNNGKTNNGKVKVKQAAHPIFAGITLPADSLELLTGTSGNGVQTINVDLAKLPGRSIVVASAPNSTSGISVAIHDVPAVVRGVTNSKYILIPLADVNYNKMTNDALTIISNALSYVISGTQFEAPSLDISAMNATVGVKTAAGVIDGTSIRAVFAIGTPLTSITPVFTLAGTGTSVTPVVATDFSNSEATPIVYTVSDMISTKTYNVTMVESVTATENARTAGFYLDGQQIRNVNLETLKVYDMAGRLVRTSTQDIMMNDLNKGIYIIQGTSGLLKVALTK